MIIRYFVEKQFLIHGKAAAFFFVRMTVPIHDSDLLRSVEPNKKLGINRNTHIINRSEFQNLRNRRSDIVKVLFPEHRYLSG